MDIEKKVLEKRRLELTRKAEELQMQLGQAQQLMQTLPVQMTAIRGQIAGIEWVLAQKEPKKRKR